MWRSVAAGTSVLLATATALATNVVTSRPSVALWLGLGTLVVLSVVLQVAVTFYEARHGGRVAPRDPITEHSRIVGPVFLGRIRARNIYASGGDQYFGVVRPAIKREDDD